MIRARDVRAFGPAARMAVGAMSTGMLLCSASARGQTLADRVAAVADGTVLLTFAARSGTCGDGRDMIAWGRTLFIWPSLEAHGTSPGVRCTPGPVRVAITKRDRAITAIRTRVGGEWGGASRDGATDLGAVPAAEAARYFVALAARLQEPVSADALLPGALADSAAIAPDLERLARDNSRPRETRRRAVSWLGRLDDPDARRALHALVEDDGMPEALRSAGILALAERGSAEELQALQRLYGRLPSEALKGSVLAAVSQLELDAGRRWLLDLTLSARHPVELRKQALFWAGEGDTPVTDLMRLYGRLRHSELKEHLIFVLSQREEEAATTELIRIARRDPDRNLRKRAIFWLGESDDPRAAEVLRQIVLQQ